jgi:hypothetical protein
MRNMMSVGAAGLAALLLAACGGGGDEGIGPPPSGAAQLRTVDDATRELGNVSTTVDLTDLSSGTPAARPAGSARSFGAVAVAHRFGGSAMQARAVQAPQAVTSCPTGGTDNATDTSSKSYAFSYFNTSATVNFRTHNYSGCASTANDGTVTTLDNQLEAGSTSDAVMGYIQSGAGNTPFRVRTTLNNNGQIFTTDQNLLGTIQLSNGQASTDNRAVLDTTLRVTQTGHTDYMGSFALAPDTGFYSVVSGQSSIAINGVYAYSSNVTGCGGGTLTTATPTPLSLGQTSAGSSFPIDGVLRITTGNDSVSFTFNADGSATLSGCVSGSLSAGEVGQILQNGSTC